VLLDGRIILIGQFSLFRRPRDYAETWKTRATVNDLQLRLGLKPLRSFSTLSRSLKWGLEVIVFFISLTASPRWCLILPSNAL
jgi:hypothetical protein